MNLLSRYLKITQNLLSDIGEAWFTSKFMASAFLKYKSINLRRFVSIRGWLLSGMENNSPPLHDWLAHFITKGPSTSSFGSAMHETEREEKKESLSASA